MDARRRRSSKRVRTALGAIAISIGILVTQLPPLMAADEERSGLTLPFLSDLDRDAALDAVKRAEPTIVSEAQLQNAIKLREDIGFNSERAFVEELFANPGRYDALTVGRQPVS